MSTDTTPRTVAAFESLAALRAFAPTSDGPTTAIVLGANQPGDGGGGIYYLDASDTTSADDGATVIVSADGGRWFRISIE